MRTIQKTGKPWLYDAETGDIVGVKDPDGSEQFFATSSERIPPGSVPVTAQVNDVTGGLEISAGSRRISELSGNTVAPRGIPGRPLVCAMKYNHWVHPAPAIVQGSESSTVAMEGSTFEAWDAWPWKCLQKYPERLPIAAREMRARPLWKWDDGQTVNQLLNGWTTGGSAVITKAEGGLNVVPSVADARIVSPDFLNLDGGGYPTIEIKLTRVSGSGWDGKLFFLTESDKVFNSTKSINLPQPADWIGEKTITATLSGNATWNNQIITQIRLDFGTNLDDVFTVRSVELVGNARGKASERITGLPINEQWAVDWELRTAYDAGIDVFSVCHFQESLTGKGKHDWYFDLLNASTVSEPIKYCIIGIYQPPYNQFFTSQNNLETIAQKYVDIIQAAGDRYWTIDGRPVIQMFSLQVVTDVMIAANFPITYSGGTSGSNRRFALAQFVSRMRNYLTAQLGVNPYIVAQQNGSDPFWFVTTDIGAPYIGTLEQAGFDAVTSYIHRTASYNHVINGAAGGGSASSWPPAATALESEQLVRSYSTMVECRDRNLDFIFGESGLGIPYWPHVTVGWARYPWSEREQKVANPEDLNWPSYKQLKANFAKARNYLDTYGPERTGNIVTIYAWDEYGEGGVLAPTKGNGYVAIEAMQDGLGL